MGFNDTVGIKDTMGFVLHCEKYGLVCTRNHDGYGIHGYGYGVGIANPRYTRAQPY